MKTKQWIAGIVLMFWATSAMAQNGNWVERFLKQYVPGTFDPAAALVPPDNEREVRAQVQNGAFPLTVDELVRLLLESSLDVTTNRFSPLLSQYSLRTLYLPFIPGFSASAAVGRNTQPSTSQLNGVAASLSQLSGSYSLSFGQYLPTGTSYSASTTVNRSSSNSAFNTFNPAYSGSITYGISQQLLLNRGRWVNMEPIRVAQNNKSMTDLQFELQVISLVTNAEIAYWNFVYAEKSIEVATQALALAQQLVHDDQREIEIGTLAAVDKIVAESAVAQREFQKVATSYADDQIQDQIKRMITNVQDPALLFAKLKPVDQVPMPKPDDRMPIPQAIAFALENRPEVRQIDIELKNHDMDVRYNKNQLLPSLSVSASYSQYGIGGVQRQLNSLGSGDASTAIVSQGGLGDAFSQMFGFNFTGYTARFNLQVPLDNKVGQANYAIATINKASAESRKALLLQQIALQVRNADSQVQMGEAQIVAAQKAHELAAQALAADQRKLQFGTIASQFVISDQQNLTQAETNEIQSLVSYAQAVVNYDQAIGRTLQRHHIEIQKEMTAGNRAMSATSERN